MRQFVLLILLACFAAYPALADGRSLPAVESAAGLQELKQKANAEGHVKVIVGFRVPFAPEGDLASSVRAIQRRDIATAARTLRARFATAAARRPSAVRTYSTLPFMALEVSPAELAKLAADPLVASITENRKLRLNLAQSSQQVRAPEAWAAGITGQGQTIAFIDTGIDKAIPSSPARWCRKPATRSAVSALAGRRPRQRRIRACPARSPASAATARMSLGSPQARVQTLPASPAMPRSSPSRSSARIRMIPITCLPGIAT